MVRIWILQMKRRNGETAKRQRVAFLTFEINSKKAWFIFEFFVPLNCQ